MDERVIEAALAGLLHDIGKVEQRSRADPWKAPDGHEDTGQPVHAAWSQYFIQHYVAAEFRGAALAGVFHHRPDRSEAENQKTSLVVALADKLSAGERADRPETDKRGQPPQQLVSIFDRVHLEGELKNEHFLPLAPLRLAENGLFPDDPLPREATRAAYEHLRDGLRSAASQEVVEPETYLERLLAALKRYTWCVPSAYYHSVPDVSLYDHSRSTSALAACLASRDEDGIRALLSAVERDFRGQSSAQGTKLLSQPLVLLIGGDISGLQSFIYTLSSRKAAQTLRGRSFYLQLLTEAVTRFVLRELGLPYANVIYDGGGHFFLLAPLEAAETLNRIRRQVSETLLHHHGVSLYLALSSTPVAATEFKLGHFGHTWDRIHARLAEAKLQRYGELGDGLYEAVFQPQPHGGNQEQTCVVCGQEGRDVSLWPEPGDPEARVCTLCRSFYEDIGSQLPGARYVVLGLTNPQRTQPGSALEALRAFGMMVSMHDVPSFDTQPERAVVWMLDDPTESESGPDLGEIPVVYRLRYTAKLELETTFDQLQKQSAGIERLGALRMDLDDAGLLFKDGFGRGSDSRASLARLSTLSFQLGLFFEGWVKQLCQRPQLRRLIYAVYAGGDDLFLIGPWDRMPELALTITRDLERYAGGNPDIHLSGGMAFIHGKYPVYQAAEDAGDALEMAKSIECKDAFAFLGRAWKWGDFATINKYRQRLIDLVSAQSEDGLGGPQAALQLLRRLAQQRQEAEDVSGRTVWGPWLWMGPYMLTRMAERSARSNRALADELLAIRDELSKEDYSRIALWGTAARWAQLQLRKQRDDEE